jgi:hypothetical protein
MWLIIPQWYKVKKNITPLTLFIARDKNLAIRQLAEHSG